MADVVKTAKNEGKKFSSDYQPPPKAKSAGWEQRRAERLLTQKILEKLTKGTNLDDYVQSLYTNAVMGNAKAIDTINKGIEDEVSKIDLTIGGMPDQFIILPNGSKIPV